MLKTRSGIVSARSGAAPILKTLLVGAAALLAFSAGCGGGGGASSLGRGAGSGLDTPATRSVPAQPASAAVAPAGLPLPSELRSVSAVQDYIKSGAQFEAGPKHQASADLFNAVFSPIASGSGPTALGTSAYAMYHFVVPGFSGNVSAYANYVGQAPVAGSAFIAVANWTKDRWDWFNEVPAVQQQFGPAADYVTANGDVYMVLMFTHSPAVTLNWLRLGTNLQPVASLLPATPQTITAGAVVSFDASASIDYDGPAPLLYDWDVDGQPGYELFNVNATLDQVYSTPGVYNATVQVHDGAGLLDTASVQITVEAGPNDPPVAALDTNTSGGGAPLNVNFDASASSDSDGSIVKYEWDWDGDAVYDFDSGLVATASHTYPDIGDFSATVRVTDNLGAMDTESTTITVTSGPAGDPPLARLSVSKWWEKTGVVMNFDASASSDPDGSITKYEWDWEGDGTFEEDTALIATATHTYATNGLRTVAVQVTDNDGNAASASFDVYVYTGGPYDEVENNDAFDSGNVLNTFPVEFFDGNVGPLGYDGDDEDWYKLVVAEGGGFQVDLRFEDDDCDVDMKLFDTDGTTEIGTSTGTDDDESITAFVDTPGTYYLRVFKYVNAPADAMADYFLNICFSNDNPVADLSASVTSGAAPLSLHLEAFPPLPSDCSLAAQDIAWDLDNDGDFETDSRVDNLRAIDVTYFRPGYTYTVSVQVTDFSNVVTTDTVAITVSGTSNEVEPNDDYLSAQSVALPLNSFFADAGDLSSNGSLEDWYSLGSLTGGQTITLHLDIFDPLCDIDMRLYRADGTTEVAASTGTDDSEDISIALPADEQYYLKVYVYSGNDLKSGGYRMSGSVAP